MKLHDYPQPLMELKEGYLVGRFCGAEICPQWRSIRHCTVDLGTWVRAGMDVHFGCVLGDKHD